MIDLSALLDGSGFGCGQLNPDHFDMDFDCGHGDSLGDWLRNHARAFQEEDLCQVWVLHPIGNVEQVSGYFTLSSHSINIDVVQRRDRTVNKGNGNEVSKLGRMPAQLLGKFALDQGVQGGAAGALLMGCVFAVHLNAAEFAGAKYLVLEAREQPLVAYYRDRFGFVQAGADRDGLISMYRSTQGIKNDIAALLPADVSETAQTDLSPDDIGTSTAQ